MMESRFKLNNYTGECDVIPLVTRKFLLSVVQPTRQQIELLEQHLVQLPQVEVPVVHRFAKGMYVRTITIPKDTLMTGKVHMFEHVSVMLSGDMTVLTEDGVKRLKGHHVFISPPGTKRVGYAHEETTWLTVHATDETDVQKLENSLVETWNLETMRLLGEPS